MTQAKLKIIEHTAYQVAYKRLQEFHKSAGDCLPRDHMKLLGRSGTGKSTLLKDYEDQHPRTATKTRTIIPALYSRVPTRPSIKKVAGRMLYDLKSPYWNKGDELERTFQLYTLLRECETEIVLLDEVQHLVDSGREKSHALVADWLKECADETKIPWLIAGLPRTNMLDEANDQFRRRFSGEIVLDSFNPAVAEDQEIIDGVVTDQIEQFNIRLDPGLDRFDLSIRVGYASDGTIGYITKLLAEVARIQDREQLKECDLEVFAQAFVNCIWASAPDKRNPFKAALEPLFLRLTRHGEPFSPKSSETECAV